MNVPAKTRPLVSVIIPVYNREDVIERAILSAASQTYPSLEILVVDDGSSDQTVHKCRQFGDRIQLITQKNAGPAAARNRGIRQANGSYIAFLDSDDEWYPDKIEKQVELALKENVPMIITDSDIRTPDNPQTTFSRSLYQKELTSSPMQILQLFEWIVMQNFIHLSTVLIKKKILPVPGPFDETMRVAEDTDLWLRVSLNHRTGIINEVLARRDVRSDKLSGDKINEFSGRIRSFLKLLNGDKVSESDRKIIRERLIWVQGRLYQRCISDRDIQGLMQAFRLLLPRMLNRNFYRGYRSGRPGYKQTS